MVALVSEVFIESLTESVRQLGLTPAFVGFIVVAIVGAAAAMMAAFKAARENRLDLSVGISFGSAVQIALFVLPAWCSSATSWGRRRCRCSSGRVRWS